MSKKRDNLKTLTCRSRRDKRLARSEKGNLRKEQEFSNKTLVEFYVFYHIDSVTGSHWGREREYPPKVVQNQLRHILNVN